MPELAIAFDAIWKRFRKGEHHDSLRDLIPMLVRRTWKRKDDRSSQDFWALRDVSFDVRPGQALGIMGSNGAGKSTILKILTRILRPTSGHCQVHGRVGALIEVASSFHGDLTGRENVFLQGAIMGMTRAETARRFDEIVEFADIGSFIDTPVKRYSNGMNARLGFSIAAHLDPQVLIIDEVLSVGDLAFQDKCLQRLLAFKRRGTAIVFVSHNVSAIAGLCDSALVLAAGRTCFTGPTEQALDFYLQSGHNDSRFESGAATFERVAIVDDHGRPVSSCRPGARLRIVAHVRFRQPAQDVSFSLSVFQTASSVCAYAVDSQTLGIAPATYHAGQCAEITFVLSAHLARGHYLLDLAARNSATDIVFARSHPAAFLQVDERATIAGIADLDAFCRVRSGIPEPGESHLPAGAGAARDSQ